MPAWTTDTEWTWRAARAASAMALAYHTFKELRRADAACLPRALAHGDDADALRGLAAGVGATRQRPAHDGQSACEAGFVDERPRHGRRGSLASTASTASTAASEESEAAADDANVDEDALPPLVGALDDCDVVADNLDDVRDTADDDAESACRARSSAARTLPSAPPARESSDVSRTRDAHLDQLLRRWVAFSLLCSASGWSGRRSWAAAATLACVALVAGLRCRVHAGGSLSGDADAAKDDETAGLLAAAADAIERSADAALDALDRRFVRLTHRKAAALALAGVAELHRVAAHALRGCPDELERVRRSTEAMARRVRLARIMAAARRARGGGARKSI